MQLRNRLKLAIIIGSTRKGRRGPSIANWFADQARLRDDLDADVVDLAETRLPEELTDQPGPDVSAMAQRFAHADMFVVVTPEYNHSFPAPLKSAIDWLSGSWKAKPVGFVSYGGRSGGLRAVEQLRQVFAELHAVTVRDSVSFHDVWAQFDTDGQPRNKDSCASAVRAMLDQLSWWGQALKDARIKIPYGF
jgi:NAD(P)H-dependent FMN reductase